MNNLYNSPWLLQSCKKIIVIKAHIYTVHKKEKNMYIYMLIYLYIYKYNKP